MTLNIPTTTYLPPNPGLKPLQSPSTSPSILFASMYGTDPFSAQHATGDVHRSGAPSIFGALPYPRSTSVDPPLHASITFQFATASHHHHSSSSSSSVHSSPYSSASSTSSSSSYAGRSSVLDCTVIGPNNEAVYRLASTTMTTTTAGTTTGGYASPLVVTQLKATRAPPSSSSSGSAGAHMHTIALVEWRSPGPTVEIRGVAAKQPVGQWLRLASDRRSRIMTYGGVYYTWAPVDRYIQLFAPGSPEWLARITKHYDTVVLELTTRAIQLGLLDVAVLATTLLQSGRNID